MASYTDYFETNLDVYGGNSGSAVASLNEQGELLYIEGILVRGNPDFVPSGACYVSNVCSDSSGCSGTNGTGWEEVTRATNFSDIIPPPCGNNICEGSESCSNCPADCGDCGSEVLLFEEDFSNGLSQWNTTGSWTTANTHYSSGYPADGSGSPVISATACSTVQH